MVVLVLLSVINWIVVIESLVVGLSLFYWIVVVFASNPYGSNYLLNRYFKSQNLYLKIHSTEGT